jgi:hypothetical protein
MTVLSDPPMDGRPSLPLAPQTPNLEAEVPELPLFYVDPPSPEHAPTIGPAGTPLPPPSLVHDTNDQELQAQEEIRQQFRWLPELLEANQRRGWGTGYRDFADVLLLLRAVSGLGMMEQGNNRVSDGVFHASTGDFTISLATFIDTMHLGHTPATWRNKLTTYFRLRSLYSYFEHAGEIRFQDPTHRLTWGVVSSWMEHQDQLLEVGWITTRFGSTELRPLIRHMVQEAYQGKHPSSRPSMMLS